MSEVVEVDAPFAQLQPDEIASAEAPASEGEFELVLPVPADAPPMPQGHPGLGPPRAQWRYRDLAGKLLFGISRFDKPDGSKEFLPLTLWREAQGFRWRSKSVPAPRPLYNLDKLAGPPDARVIICEGESSADAAALIFPESVAVTAPGGANAADKADWTPLRGRKVLIWPDDDVPGRGYALRVGTTSAALDCDVSIIDAHALARTAPGGGRREPSKKGWDAADAITEWDDREALRRAAIGCAKPFDAAESDPAYISFDKFEMNAHGLHAELNGGRSDNSEIAMVRVSAPFEILGRGRDPDGRAWGRFLRWRDPDGRMHEKFVADEILHREPASLCAPLAAEGLEIVREQQRAFALYLSGAQTTRRVTVVHRTGWHEIEGENVFVLPSQTIGRKGVGRVFLDGAGGPYDAKGTLADWRSSVATLASGHAIAMLAISTAFAGPLLHLAGLEGGGLNLFGQSSRGKTTTLERSRVSCHAPKRLQPLADMPHHPTAS